MRCLDALNEPFQSQYLSLLMHDSCACRALGDRRRVLLTRNDGEFECPQHLAHDPPVLCRATSTGSLTLTEASRASNVRGNPSI
jgi:hypothetical protein